METLQTGGDQRDSRYWRRPGETLETTRETVGDSRVRLEDTIETC